MPALLRFAHGIDRLTTFVGRTVSWFVLVACIVAVGNALARKLLGLGSNAWLEMQWFLFSAVFLLASPWTLAVNEHVRIDILTGRLSERARAWIDILGHTLFLIPVTIMVLWLAIPFARTSIQGAEGSSNYGGLPQWPLKVLIPIAFALLLVQALSELIKSIARLQGATPPPPAGISHGS